MRGIEERRAAAFAPGHVTGIFVPDLTSSDPRGRGSRGLGLVLGSGARAVAVWQPGPRSRVRIRDSVGGDLPLTEEAVRHLAPPCSGSLSVVVHHELPVGQGFGMSAAGTLATSLAVAALFSLPKRRAVEVAHLAELLGGGGLGGVPAILGGGLEFRRVAGIPPWGRIDHLPFPAPVLIGVVGGPLPSPRLLGQSRILQRVARAGREMDHLGSAPSPDEFLEVSERFTDRLRLASPPLVRVVRALRRRGWWAAQAMFGRSFFAVAPTDRTRASGLDLLQRWSVPAVELAVDPIGSRRLRAPSGSDAPGDATILTGRPSRLRP
ncbi:MAG: hypothetical protein ACLPZM_00190 [Thermoplasmata archaeon]